MDDRRALASELVAREAMLLDERDWDAWLALYTDDAQFWVPTWRDEQHLTEDPAREISFMFLQGKAMLAERVFRLASGRSAASLLAPRTSHLVGASIVTETSDGLLVKSAWTSHVWHHKDAALLTYAGRYQHLLVPTEQGLRIRRKKIILVNDRLASPVDFFHL